MERTTNRCRQMIRQLCAPMACAAVILGGAFVKVMVDNSEMTRVQSDNTTLTALLVGFGFLYKHSVDIGVLTPPLRGVRSSLRLRRSNDV